MAIQNNSWKRKIDKKIKFLLKLINKYKTNANYIFGTFTNEL